MVLILLASWIAAVLFVRLVIVPMLSRGPGGDPLTGILWRSARVFTSSWHRLKIEGRDRLPSIKDRVGVAIASSSDDSSGGLIVVANHTGAIDPFLIQSACPFKIRWMMASDMMSPGLSWLWDHLDLIPVARDGSDTRATREAIRYVRSGGVLGIFPEGRIVSPPCEIRPFYDGVGVIVSRAKVPVLLTWVSGTPRTTDMSKSLTMRSHARVRFIEQIAFGSDDDARSVTRVLRKRLSEASGWPLNDKPLPPIKPPPDPFGVPA